MKTIAMPSLVLQLGQQLEDLRLHRHVERRGRLVGDQHVGVAGERHGDHHPLPLAAGELVRVGVDPPLGLGDADEAQELDDARAGLGLRAGRDGSAAARPAGRRSGRAGSSEVIGSWKIMVILSPRILLSSRSGSPRISRPRYFADPVARPFEARRPMIAIVVWLLPEPDSPTIATVSFGMTSRSIPLTASTMPSLVSNSTRQAADAEHRVRISAVLRIERVAQAVAEEVRARRG